MIIIKSMSRKSKSFSQLYDYLTRDTSSFSFSRNTYTNSKNRKAFVNEFYDNARYLRDARGKVFMYHEVLSLEENNLTIDRQKEILQDLAEKYLYQRAEHHLAFGVIHEDKNNMHVHLMISANEIESERRVRLSKKEYSQIQQRLENYKNQKYKELSQSSLYKDKKDLSKDKQNEQELKNRAKKSIKDKIKEELEKIFDKSISKMNLEKYLKASGYEVYTRGKTQGVTFNGKNYRFKTLGLDVEYKQLLNSFDNIKERKSTWEKLKEEKAKNPKFYRDIGRKKDSEKAELHQEQER